MNLGYRPLMIARFKTVVTLFFLHDFIQIFTDLFQIH